MSRKFFRCCRHETGFAVFGGAFVIVLRGGRCFAGARQDDKRKKREINPKDGTIRS
jgi:hypothetical protein